MKTLGDSSPVALSLLIGAVSVTAVVCIAWASFSSTTSLRLDALEKDAAKTEAVHIADIEWKKGVKDDLEVIKDKLNRLHYTVKKAASKEVASRKTEDSKLKCSLYQPGPYSMTE